MFIFSKYILPGVVEKLKLIEAAGWISSGNKLELVFVLSSKFSPIISADELTDKVDVSGPTVVKSAASVNEGIP